MKQDIEQSLKQVDEALEQITIATQKSEDIQAQISDLTSKELAVLEDDSLSAEQKAKKLIESRTLVEVLSDSLAKARAEQSNLEHSAIKIGQAAHGLICTFRDEVRQQAIEKAAHQINELLRLEKGEDRAFANRSRAVHAIDHVETVGWSKASSRHTEMVQNLSKLRAIFLKYQAVADSLS